MSRHVKCYKFHCELSAKFCVILYQRKTCEGQEIQTFPSNKYQLHNKILQFGFNYFKVRKKILL